MNSVIVFGVVSQTSPRWLTRQVGGMKDLAHMKRSVEALGLGKRAQEARPHLINI
jgi:hypothetical protein